MIPNKVLILYFDLKAEYFIPVDQDELTTDLRVQAYWSVLYSSFSGPTMANFGGHAIPGTFFMLYGFWLTVKHVLQYNWRTRQPKGRQIMPPFFKKMEYFEGGLQIFASFVGQFSFKSIFDTCTSWSIAWFCVMLCGFRYYGWAVCGGWPTRPPLQQGGQFMGQADELAAQHNVSVLWDFRSSIDC